MGLLSFFAKQSKKPSGWVGRMLIGKLLNKSNATLEDMGLKLMDIKPESAILEIGFGNGRLIYKMGKVIKQGNITGIEISKEMIVQAENKNSELIKSGHLKLIEASVEKIPADNDCFDKIFTANTIYFWPNPDENIKEIIRTLKPGGTFYCALRLKEEMKANKAIRTNPDIFKYLFSEDEIIEFLKKAGLKDVTTYKEEQKIFTDFIATGTR